MMTILAETKASNQEHQPNQGQTLMRIRNLYTHKQEPEEVEALEALASISLLARWIDQAVVVHAEDQ